MWNINLFMLPSLMFWMFCNPDKNVAVSLMRDWLAHSSKLWRFPRRLWVVFYTLHDKLIYPQIKQIAESSWIHLADFCLEIKKEQAAKHKHSTGTNQYNSTIRVSMSAGRIFQTVWNNSFVLLRRSSIIRVDYSNW